MKKYYAKEELKNDIKEKKLSPIELYKQVLSKEFITRFPVGYWYLPNANSNAIEISKYLIEEKLKLSDEQLKKQLSVSLFTNNRLNGMLCQLFNNSPYLLINNIYPGRFKPSDFRNAPIKYWNINSMKDKSAVDIFKAILSGEIKKYPDKFWTCNNKYNNAKDIIIYIIEELLNIVPEDIPKKITLRQLNTYNIYSLTRGLFNNVLYDIINNAYPDKFLKWELYNTKKWDLETSKEATKWLIEEKLKLSDDELKEQLCQNMFTKNNLGGMLSIVFENSPFKAIDSIYPNKFKSWEFKNNKHNCWDIDTASIAIKELIEDKLHYSDDDIRKYVGNPFFRKYRLGHMIFKVFNNSTYKAIDTVYPNKFKPWEFDNINIVWDMKLGMTAMYYTFHTKLGMTVDDVIELNPTRTFFKRTPFNRNVKISI